MSNTSKEYALKLFKVAFPGVPEEEFDRLSNEDFERYLRMGKLLHHEVEGSRV